MVIYSHSRLSTFEQCRLKFKFKYLDKIETLDKTIEAFLGKIIHNTLEWLYLQIKEKKIPSIEEIINYYSNNWEENYDENIRIVKKNTTIEDYFNKGIQFILGYYTKHHPFKDNTLEVEKKILIDLDSEGKYKIQGFIDRLVHNLERDELEIHDYKTANNLPTKEKIEEDRQLALYSIAIKELYQDKETILIWHFLAHNIKICSKRTNEQLEKLKKDTLNLIKEIESTSEFPPQESILCNWCEYKNICPQFKPKNQTLDIWN